MKIIIPDVDTKIVCFFCNIFKCLDYFNKVDNDYRITTSLSKFAVRLKLVEYSFQAFNSVELF